MNQLAHITPARLPQAYEARCCVYMVQSPISGAVKIGFSGNVQDRVRALETGAGADLSVLRIIPGGASTEAWLHRRFSNYRIKGEWFSFHPDMLTVVAPDEVPVRKTIVQRRDIRQTLKERVREAEAIGAETGLSAQQVLLMVAGRMTEEEAASALLKIANAA